MLDVPSALPGRRASRLAKWLPIGLIASGAVLFFALGFHRKRRDAKARESILDALPGVGPARRRALIQHFGSPERLVNASREELEGVPGVPAKTGRQIYAALHRTGRA